VVDKTLKVQLPGSTEVAPAVEVAVNESTERWTDINLADGTQIRIKTIVLAVYRVDGHYDNDGNPLYQLKANQIMTVTSPEHMRKGAGGSTAH
jgi:hypothetical protein